MFNGAFILQALLHPYWVPSSVPSSRNKIVSNKVTMRVVFYPGGKTRSWLESLAEMIAVQCYWIGGMLVCCTSPPLFFWKTLGFYMFDSVYIESQASAISEDSLK